MSAEGDGSRFTHVTRQHGRLDLAQVHHDQAVERVAELTIRAECEDPATESQVLLEQYRNTLVVGLDLRDRPGQFIDTPRNRDPRVRSRYSCSVTIWTPRPDLT